MDYGLWREGEREGEKKRREDVNGKEDWIRDRERERE